MNQAIRVLPGLAFTDKVPLPGYGTITLASAAAAIKAIYESSLNSGWADYAARGGCPKLPAAQKAVPPDNSQELK